MYTSAIVWLRSLHIRMRLRVSGRRLWYFVGNKRPHVLCISSAQLLATVVGDLLSFVMFYLVRAFTFGVLCITINGSTKLLLLLLLSCCFCCFCCFCCHRSFVAYSTHNFLLYASSFFTLHNSLAKYRLGLLFAFCFVKVIFIT